MTTEQLEYRPEAVEYEEGPVLVSVILRTEVQEHTRGEGEPPYWTCNMTRLELEPDELTEGLRRAIEAEPEKYVSYVPRRRRAAVQKQYTDAVQAWMNAEAQTHGYDDIFTAVGYVGDPNERFAAEGEACRAWRSEVWTACYAYLDAVLAGEEELVPEEELIDRLPQLTWPND